MDEFKRTGIRAADFIVTFSSNGGRTRASVATRRYLKQYYEPDSLETDPKVLRELQILGIQKALDAEARKRALRLIRSVLASRSRSSATGRIQVVFLDDECLPAPSGPPQIHEEKEKDRAGQNVP